MREQRIVVLTGATRGLGRAMSLEFSRLGHTVLGCGTAVELVQSLQKELGAPHEVALVDVAQDGQVQDWAKHVIQAHGAPDLLLNNAGVINRNGPLWKVTAEEFARVVDVNIKGVANVIRHFVPAMIRRRTGVIVNFSSGWGRSTDAQVAPYCATKWAIEGLTQALAQELPSGLTAIPLNPGIIDTEMLRSCFGSSARSFRGPAVWAKTAVPFLLQLSAKDNGRSLTAP